MSLSGRDASTPEPTMSAVCSLKNENEDSGCQVWAGSHTSRGRMCVSSKNRGEAAPDRDAATRIIS